MNLNQELVKQGWCWWYRKYAPADTVLEGLEKEARQLLSSFSCSPKASRLPILQRGKNGPKAILPPKYFLQVFCLTPPALIL